MPLPRAKGNPNDAELTMPENNGARFLDKNIKKEITDPLDDGEKDESDLSFLQSGQMGGATWTVDSNPNLVIKYTRDKSEIESAEKLAELKKEHGKLPFVVDIYEFGEVPNSEGVYRLVVEKVIPLNKTKYREYLYLLFDWNGGHSYSSKKGVSPYVFFHRYDLESAKKVFESESENEKFDEKLYLETSSKMAELIKQMENFNFRSNDMHLGNMGVRNDGSFVILDIGSSSFWKM